jgi:glc operon protein GlcG
MRTRNFVLLGIFAASLLSARLTPAQTAEKRSLTLEGAERIIAASKAKARELNAPGGVIAVVDAGGNLMALERIDGTFAAGATISIGKARTAVLFQKPTKVFEEIINKGRTAMAALPDSFFTPLQGGVPVILNGEIIGGVGVSGASSAAQDEELAIAGAEAAKSFSSGAATATNSTVTFFDNTKAPSGSTFCRS